MLEALLSSTSPSISTALDEIIKSNPKKRLPKPSSRGRGGRRPGGGAKATAVGAKAGNAAAAAAVAANRNKPLVIPGRVPGGAQGSKIIVSNLPLDVTEAQVKVRRHTGIVSSHTRIHASSS